ncbi:MAG TPA: hypothetical protein VEN12_12435 [Verrucomicrobiae bacterium]|nr:hypothetical protein [Verrucomicrobiae bacterium]
MTLYSAALFLHIVGALLLFVLLTVEGFSLRLGMPAARFNQVAGPISAVFVLFPGLYMVATTWGWKGWIAVGIASWVLIAVLGAITGVSVLRGRISVRTASLSWSIRVGLATGVVFIMTVKPDLVLATLAVLAGALLGLAAGRIVSRRVVPA